MTESPERPRVAESSPPYASGGRLDLAGVRLEDCLHDLLENIRLASIVLDREGRVVFCNDYFLDLTQWSRQEVLGNDFAERFLPPDARESLRAKFLAYFIERGVPPENENVILTRSGERRLIVWYHTVLRDDSGRALALAGVGEDITQRQLAEKQHRRLAKAVEQASEAIVITDTAGLIEYVNPAFERITGYNETEALGRNASVLKSGLHDEDFYRRMWDTLLRGEVWNGVFRNRHKAGHVFEERATISPIRDDSGRIRSFVAVKRDITEEMKREAQLRQIQKMEAMGQLAGGIAHDFNNLLQAIQGYTQLLMAHLPAEGSAQEDLKQIMTASERAAFLTRQLLAFSRKQVLRPRLIDLNESIADTTKMLARLIGEHIRLEFEPAPELWRIRADAGHVSQLLINLAVNARDAMPDGGQLKIETRNVQLDQDEGEGEERLPAGRYVTLKVRDTGHGIPAEVMRHIFEPFFTTKEVGRGTGLGLSTVYGIVQQHHGRIRVESEGGVGTTFLIHLPAAEVGAVAEPISALEPARGAGELILVAEDDDLVRELTTRTLRHGGYEVLAAIDGEEALALFEENRDRIDLICLDIVMPKLNGRDIYERIRVLKPEQAFIFVSGYVQDLIDQRTFPAGGVELISKPYSPRDLLGAVRRSLDESRGWSAPYAGDDSPPVRPGNL